jgi:hypothetical protein
MYTVSLYNDVVAALIHFPCAVTLDSVTEKRLPLGRLERVSRVTARYWPEPAEQVLGFHPDEEEKTVDYRLPELARCMELIDTPDGKLRGRGINCTVKDGAAVVSAAYTEWLCEVEDRKPGMGTVEIQLSL